MKQGRKNADLAVVSRFNPDRGQEIFGIPVDPPNAIFGVLWYFALLAYPDRSESKDRENFSKALHSWRCKNARADISYWQQLPPEIRGLTNKSIGGKLHMGLRRIVKRLLAGSIALSLYVKDRPLPGFNPTTRDGTGVVLASDGPGTVTEALQEFLKLDMEETGKRYDRYEPGVIERDVVENRRNEVWTKALPVLHLAVTLYVWLCSFPSKVPWWARLYRLIHDPRWLRDALVYAEDWRVLLDTYRIPSFDKNEAIRLIRAD